MYSLRIEHSTPNFENWKKLFDSDPLDRKKMGVRRYRILRAADDAKHVVVVLEFEQLDQAQAAESALRNMWSKLEGNVMSNAQTRILENVEFKEL